MHIGFQVSSLRPLLTTAQGVRDAFFALSQMGYRTLQIQWIDPSVADEDVALALADTGLRCVAVQDLFDAVEENCERFVRQSVLWGAKTVTISGIPEWCADAISLRVFINRVLRLYARLGDEGLNLSFHPRAADYRQIGGAPATYRLMDALPYDCQVTPDLYHARKAGLSLPALLRRFAGRADMVHFKDARVTPEGETLCPLGQGDADWTEAIAACKKTGVKWCFVEQERWTGDPMLAMRQSLDYMRARGVR